MKSFAVIYLIAFIFSCVDYSEGDFTAPLSQYRIPIGSCADVSGQTGTFTQVYGYFSRDPLNPAVDTDKKGCNNVSCHSNSSGGTNKWALGVDQASTFASSIINVASSVSGRNLINDNSVFNDSTNLEKSEILQRLSQNANRMPSAPGEIWTDTDLDILKVWICEGAQNN